ncbi:hypothetical protein [Paenibacillus kobensis]|uniref:hypothetical protein n=1 Tax=Paenibacillus kobensis TaxID=59841 RepID=UPI000FD8694B|nr:hypothetical protein [Paenibacillus kobensis]
MNMTEYRISDSETMCNKLTYQIRTGSIQGMELDRLQLQCKKELQELRTELDQLLAELREAAERMNGYKNKNERSIAA